MFYCHIMSQLTVYNAVKGNGNEGSNQEQEIKDEHTCSTKQPLKYHNHVESVDCKGF
jgi:hypothetical protein